MSLHLLEYSFQWADRDYIYWQTLVNLHLKQTLNKDVNYLVGIFGINDCVEVYALRIFTVACPERRRWIMASNHSLQFYDSLLNAMIYFARMFCIHQI